MKCTGSKLFVIGNRNGDGGISDAFLHDDVAAAAADLAKTVRRQNRTDLRA